MKLNLMLVLALFSGVGSVNAQENSLPSQPHLLVKGQAERSVAPDRFTVTISLQRVDMSPEKARTLAQADAAQTLKAFKDHHALRDSIEAAALSIQPQYVYEQNRQVFKGTQVSRTLTATFSSLEDVRKLLAETRTSENVMLTGISTGYSGEPELRAQLKREAADQSRRSAQGLASAYGARITGLYTISDVAPSFAYGVQAGSWPRDATGLAPPPPAPVASMAEPRPSDVYQAAESLEAGTLDISENVYAIFLIAQ
ncbi:MAG: SIMPL domain-containing protein [Pseudoxanthomonas sp.]